MGHGLAWPPARATRALHPLTREDGRYHEKGWQAAAFGLPTRRRRPCPAGCCGRPPKEGPGRECGGRLSPHSQYRRAGSQQQREAEAEGSGRQNRVTRGRAGASARARCRPLPSAPCAPRRIWRALPSLPLPRAAPDQAVLRDVRETERELESELEDRILYRCLHRCLWRTTAARGRLHTIGTRTPVLFVHHRSSRTFGVQRCGGRRDRLPQPDPSLTGWKAAKTGGVSRVDHCQRFARHQPFWTV